jgi:hypothetical protein
LPKHQSRRAAHTLPAVFSWQYHLGMDEGGDIEASERTALRPSRSLQGEGLEERRFTPGSMLAGRFRIVALLGRGGMGEVYRAEDVKLRQQVALKFLPAAVASRPDKLARLYGEVRLGRQISYPNIARRRRFSAAGCQRFAH